MLETLKAVFWVGSATLFNLLVWIVAGKVMAVMAGPVGVGIYGLLRQLAQNLNVASTFNGSTTLVQGLASRSQGERQAYAKNIGLVFLGLGLVFSILLVVLSPWLGPILLGKRLPASVLRWMVLPLLGMSLSTYFLGLLNGYRHLKALVVCQAIGPVVALTLIYPVISCAKAGGYWAFSLILGVPYAAIGLAAAWVAYRQGWLVSPAGPVVSHFLRRDLRHFFSLSSALLIGGGATSGLQFFLNVLVFRKLGLAESGQFWVAWTLSMSYVGILLGSFGTYYLPSLSATCDSEAKRAMILSFTRLVLLVMPLLVSFMVVLKFQMIGLLFSHDLLPSLKVFRWMLLGDYFKVLAWVWAFPMLAFAEGKTFVLFEITTSLIWGFLAWFVFLHFPIIEGLGVVFFLVYVLYAAATLVYLGRRQGIQLTRAHWWGLVRGLGVIAIASVLFWDHNHFSFGRALTALAPGVLNLWLSLSPNERQSLGKRIKYRNA